MCIAVVVALVCTPFMAFGAIFKFELYLNRSGCERPKVLAVSAGFQLFGWWAAVAASA